MQIYKDVLGTYAGYFEFGEPFLVLEYEKDFCEKYDVLLILQVVKGKSLLGYIPLFKEFYVSNAVYGKQNIIAFTGEEK